MSHLNPSNEKCTPASLLAASSVIGFPARPESPSRGGADAVGTGCTFQHRALYAHLPQKVCQQQEVLGVWARVMKMCRWPPREGPAWPRGKGRYKVEVGRQQGRPYSTLVSTGRPPTAIATGPGPEPEGPVLKPTSAPGSSPNPAGARPRSV